MINDVLQKLLARRSDSNKYDFGHVLVIGGSLGMVGAPFLTAMGALRVGAGLVTIASTFDVIDKLEKRVVEVMTLGISTDPAESIKTLTDFIEKRRVSVIVLGPGMDDSWSTLVKNLVPQLSIPIVLDAGALTCFGDDISILDEVTTLNPDVIATPHDGEFEKLAGTKLPIESEARKESASRFALTHHLTLLCKGSPTLVAHRDGTISVNPTGNPGLATAGSGDVLAGIIAGLVSQGCASSDAVEVGAYLHGASADLAVREKTQPGLIASDIFDFLPNALRDSMQR